MIVESLQMEACERSLIGAPLQVVRAGGCQRKDGLQFKPVQSTTCPSSFALYGAAAG